MSPLDIVSLDSPTTTLASIASSSVPSWFPDGARFIFQDWVALDAVREKSGIPAQLLALASVREFDVRARCATLVGWGFKPRLSTDGERWIARVSTNECSLVTVETGAQEMIALNHLVDGDIWWRGSVLALAGHAWLIYEGRPNEGQDPGWFWSPSIAPQKRTCIRMKNLETGADDVILPSYGADWSDVSVGGN